MPRCMSLRSPAPVTAGSLHLADINNERKHLQTDLGWPPFPVQLFPPRLVPRLRPGRRRPHLSKLARRLTHTDTTTTPEQALHNYQRFSPHGALDRRVFLGTREGRGRGRGRAGKTSRCR